MTRTIARALELTIENGGGTFEAMSLDDVPARTAKDAWAVGGSRGIATILVDPQDGPAFADAYLAVRGQGAPVFGTWVDAGVINVDAVDMIGDRQDAIELGELRGEASIYNIQTEELVWLRQAQRGPGFKPGDPVAKLKSAAAQRRQVRAQRATNREMNRR